VPNLLKSAGAVRLGRRVEPVHGAPPPTEAAAAAIEPAERHRSIERSRMEMMRRYAELTDCRRRFPLRYFGECTQEPCGRCDNCESGWSTPADEEDATYAPGERVDHRDWGRGTLLGYKDGRRIAVRDRRAGESRHRRAVRRVAVRHRAAARPRHDHRRAELDPVRPPAAAAHPRQQDDQAARP
jgi:ATP-dependent DNA helicase RecQ